MPNSKVYLSKKFKKCNGCNKTSRKCQTGSVKVPENVYLPSGMFFAATENLFNIADLRGRTTMAGILTMILAGGERCRLQPLTTTTSKPSVPFGGSYRLIDFVLNNFVNADFLRIYVLHPVQVPVLYLHMKRAGTSSASPDRFIDPIPAQMRMGKRWYDGTADAIYQNLRFIEIGRPRPRLHLRLRSHLQDGREPDGDFHKQKAAALTVAALRMPIERQAPSGVIEVDRKAHDWL